MIGQAPPPLAQCGGKVAVERAAAIRVQKYALTLIVARVVGVGLRGGGRTRNEEKGKKKGRKSRLPH